MESFHSLPSPTQGKADLQLPVTKSAEWICLFRKLTGFLLHSPRPHKTASGLFTALRSPPRLKRTTATNYKERRVVDFLFFLHLAGVSLFHPPGKTILTFLPLRPEEGQDYSSQQQREWLVEDWPTPRDTNAEQKPRPPSPSPFASLYKHKPVKPPATKGMLSSGLTCSSVCLPMTQTDALDHSFAFDKKREPGATTVEFFFTNS